MFREKRRDRTEGSEGRRGIVGVEERREGRRRGREEGVEESNGIRESDYRIGVFRGKGWDRREGREGKREGRGGKKGGETKREGGRGGGE